MNDKIQPEAGTREAAKPEGAAKPDGWAQQGGAAVAKVLRWLSETRVVKQVGGVLNYMADAFCATLFESIRDGNSRIGSAVFLLCGFALLFLSRPVSDLGSNIVCATASLFGRSECAGGSAIVAALACLWSLIALAMAIFVARVAFTLNSKVASIECAIVEPKDRPSRVIVTGLSLWLNKDETPQKMFERFTSEQLRRGAAPTIEAFCDPDFSGGNWQQTIRRIRPEIAAGTLEKVYVIPSLQSGDQWNDFEALLSNLGGAELANKFVRTPNVNYEEFEKVTAAIDACVERAAKDVLNLKPRDICIDITAGFKVFSAAAALFTLNRALAFSYVTMEESTLLDGSTMPKGSVRLYDAQARFYRDFHKTLEGIN